MASSVNQVSGTEGERCNVVYLRVMFLVKKAYLTLCYRLPCRNATLSSRILNRVYFSYVKTGFNRFYHIKNKLSRPTHKQ